MTVINYLRCSTEDQADSKNGLHAQADACSKWATAHGESVRGTFSDEGISGAAGIEKRPGLMAAINALESGDVLLVAKRDRLGRDPLVVAMIEATVARRKARIVSSAGEGTEGDDPSQVLMRRMVDAFSEYERLIIKARTKAALGAKKARGERTGGIPFGFSLANDGKNLIENPAEQGIINEARTMKAAGLSLRGIAQTLADHGFNARNGKPFQAVQIQRMVA